MFRLSKLLSVVSLIALPFSPLLAQDSRAGSFEFNGSVGALYLDGTFANYFSRNGFSNDNSRFVPALGASLGYNISNQFSFGVGITGARETSFKSTLPYLETTGGRYLSPSVSLSYSPNLNARFSPFVTGGTQFTRVTGHGQKTHPTWGSFVGGGLRLKVDDNTNLKLEGRLSPEHYAEFNHRQTSYNGTLLLGLSYSTQGRKAPKPVIQYVQSKPDTVKVYIQPKPCECKPIVIKDTLVLEGVNFEFDSDRLLDDSKEILDRVANELNKAQWSNVRFEVAGHTSRVGSDAWNLDLSNRRSSAVKDYLIGRGVSANRMVANGYGESQLLVQESENGDNPRNRRVELRKVK